MTILQLAGTANTAVRLWEEVPFAFRCGAWTVSVHFGEDAVL